MNFKEFKKLAMVKSFVELYQHYFQLFLIAKGYFSKNLSHHMFHEICERFCEIIHFPSDVLESLQAREIGLDTIGIIDWRVVEIMAQISGSDIISAFSQLEAIKIYKER